MKAGKIEGPVCVEFSVAQVNHVLATAAVTDNIWTVLSGLLRCISTLPTAAPFGLDDLFGLDGQDGGTPPDSASTLRV